MWKLTKQYWKDMWNYIWSKTSVDEKAIATIKEIKKRYKLTAQELKDVADAVCGAVWSAARSREVRSDGGFVDEEGQPIRTPSQRPQGRIRPPGLPRR